MSEDTPTKVPFSAQAVWDGYWEFYHDDDCDAVLDPDTKVCSACGWRPDLQSMGARRTGKDVGANQSSTPLPSSEGTTKNEPRLQERLNAACVDAAREIDAENPVIVEELADMIYKHIRIALIGPDPSVPLKSETPSDFGNTRCPFIFPGGDYCGSDVGHTTEHRRSVNCLEKPALKSETVPTEAAKPKERAQKLAPKFVADYMNEHGITHFGWESATRLLRAFTAEVLNHEF